MQTKQELRVAVHVVVESTNSEGPCDKIKSGEIEKLVAYL